MNKKLLVRLLSLALFSLLVYFIRGTLFPLVLALVLYYALKPLYSLLLKLLPKKLPLVKDLSIIVSFVVFIILALFFIDFLLPPFISEFNQLVNNLPAFIKQAQSLADTSQKFYLNIHLPENFNKAVFDGVGGLMGHVLGFLEQTFSGLLNIVAQFIGLIVMPVIVYYLLKEDNDLVEGVQKLVPADHRDFVKAVMKKIDLILKSYVEGQLFICTLIGVVTGFVLYLLGINYYLVLALIAGVTELIPIIGPLIGAIPALIIAYLISPALAVKVLLAYIVIQTIGAYVLAPKIMGDKLDIHPLTIILGVLILGSLIGVWGIFFAAPIIAILKVVYLEIGKN